MAEFAAAAAVAAAVPVAPVAGAAADEDEDAAGDEAEAAWATCAALLIMEVAAEMALARLGREPLEGGARMLASGDEAAEASKLAARPEEAEAVLTGRVWM